MYMAEVSFRGEAGPLAQPEELDRTRRLLGNAREIGGHRVGDVPARGVLEGAAEHSPRRVEQQEPFLGPFESREYARLLRGLGRRGDRLRFYERLGPPAPRRGGTTLFRPPAAGHGQGLGDPGIVRGSALRRLEVGRRLLDVADLEIEEREALQRSDVVGGDAERHVPLVERALVVVLVGEDARVQVVRVREVRMALEPRHGDAVGGVEVPLLAQQLAEPEEDETVRVLRELGGQRLDLVSHASPSPRGSGPPLWRDAPRRAAPAPSPSARRAVPTGPTVRPPRRSGRWRRVRSRARGARPRPADPAGARGAAPRPRRRRVRRRARCGPAAAGPSGPGDAPPLPAGRGREPARGRGARRHPPRAPRARPDRRRAWSARVWSCPGPPAR